MRDVSFILNDTPTHITVDETRMLLWVLRDDLGFTGTKFGCGQAVCGACTVLIDDQPVRSCATPMRDVAGKHVVTIEGLAHGDRLHPVQQAFIDHLGFQCGYCTPGMILGTYALLKKNPKPTHADIARELDGHLCRCGAHERIIKAVDGAAAVMRGGAR
jgi:aerobic-type carbon monoxide dehydrogenase small subunit (CoxS/CutS family)